MRLLFVCNEYPPNPHGGIGSFTKLMAERLAFQGYEVAVVGYGNKTSVGKVNNVTVYSFTKKYQKLKFISTLILRIDFYFKIQKVLKGFRPDIIESYDWSGPLIFKPKKTRLLVRLHGSNTSFNKYIGLPESKIYKFLEKRALKCSDHLVSVSDHIADLTRKDFNIKSKITTIYNGVDTNKFINNNAKRNNNKLLLVGRMHPNKGFENLFGILNQIFRKNHNIHLDVVCTVIDSYKLKLLELVEQKFHSRINFLGRIPNEKLVDYYNIANMTILPSRAEAFPIIPLESMACGTPVIMSNRFSAYEIVKDGVDGFLVDITNPELFAAQILEILENQAKIAEMRISSRKKIENNFSLEKVLSDNLNVYKSILDPCITLQ